uniref:Telomeric single stranded DNA binding POT1/Cdc13 domain-containing protein n=1 Tax=Parascaris univalens TaxID=6257 RepID=A0A915CHV6_PARUN
MTTVIGIITDVDNAANRILFWTKDLAEELIVVAPQKEISPLKIGDWISVPSEEVQQRRIETFHVIDDPIPTKIFATPKSSLKKRIFLRICIAFPPIKWAELNGYNLLAYGENIGTIGNFASKRLTEMNGEIERDVCYEGEIVNLPQNLFTQEYRTIWAIRAQQLRRIDNDAFLSTCPWHEISDEEISLNGDQLKSEGRSSPIMSNEDPIEGNRESSRNCWCIDEEAMKGPLPMIVSPEPHEGTKERRLSSENFIGIVIRCEAHYTLIFGKIHGLVLVTYDAALSLRLGDWVSYDCIVLEEPDIAGVRHLAVCCREIDNRPCVSTINNGIIQIFTKVKVSHNNDREVPDGFVLMACDFIGAILAPNSADLRDTIEDDRIDAIVRFDDESYPGFSWIMTSFFKDGVAIPIESSDSRDTESVNKPSTVTSDCDELIACNAISDLNDQSFHTAEMPQAESSSSSHRSLHPSSSISDTALRDVDSDRRISDTDSQVGSARSNVRNSSHQQRKIWLIDASTLSSTASQLSNYRPGSVTKKVPMAILVKRSAKYGIIWSFHYKSIVVSLEHLGDLCAGVWVKTKIAEVEDSNNCLQYRYMTVAPLVRIADKLPLRCQDGIIQVQVHLEVGGELFIEGKHSYFMKNSELGQVLLNDDRMRPEDQQKRFLAWATFFQHDESYPWMIPYRETLVEIDDLGNPIEEQCNVPRRYDIGATDISCQGGGEDESVHYVSNDPICSEGRSSSIDCKRRDVCDRKQRCRRLS